ncbi:DUF262 domain-containing protein [Escherichia coli]|nr:DUF262 domain-containing protein [Escherichia coli]
MSDLFTDLATHQDKSAYRLGSVVFHQHTDSEQGEMLDIVDGQQRTLTLMLTVKALIEVLDNENRSGKEKSIRFQRQDLREQLQVLRGPIDAFMQRQRFPAGIRSSTSDATIWSCVRLNRPALSLTSSKLTFCSAAVRWSALYCRISRGVPVLRFAKCPGRDLASHDLLKAFHLREFAGHEANLKAGGGRPLGAPAERRAGQSVRPLSLSGTPVGRGQVGPLLWQGEVDLFKGVNLDRVGHYPYV